MSFITLSISEAVQRLRCHDHTLETIDLTSDQLTDTELTDLVDCLLANPDVVTLVNLGFNQLTDETGVKLARYLAASSTIRSLYLTFNQFSEVTYLSMAMALRVNSSLRFLYLFNNQAINIENQTRIDAAFIDALILNPVRPTGSKWYLYEYSNDFKRLKAKAEQLGHPSLQASLATQLIRAF